MNKNFRRYFSRQKISMSFFSMIRYNFFLYALIGIICFFVIEEVPFFNRLNAVHYQGYREAILVFQHKTASGQPLNEYDLKAARDFLKEALDLAGPVATLYGNLGFCYFYLGQAEKALHMYEKAISLDPAHYIYWWDKGMIYFDLGRHEEAISHFERSIELIPGVGPYYFSKAGAFPLPDWQNQVLGFIPKAIERSRDNAQIAFIRIAQSYSLLGQPEQATQAAFMSTQIASEDPGGSEQVQRVKYSVYYQEKNAILKDNLEPLLHFDHDLILMEVAINALQKVLK